MSEPASKKQTPRRWLRFSLRAALVVLTLACLVGWYLNRAQSQREAIRLINKHGGVAYHRGTKEQPFLHEPGDLSPWKLACFRWLEKKDALNYVFSPITVSQHGYEVTNLRPLGQLRGLEDVSLSNCEALREITPLSRLRRLRTLDLSGSQVSDLKPLAGLHDLRELYLAKTQVADISPLAGLTKLRQLDLTETAVGDVTPLAGLTELEFVGLRETQVTSLEALQDRPDLWVDVEASKLNGERIQALIIRYEIDLQPLRRMTKVTRLRLEHVLVDHLEPLLGMPDLRELTLSNSDVADVSALARLSNLEKLTLSYTKIPDLKPLASVPNLKSLEVFHLSTKNWQALQNCQSLERLRIQPSPWGQNHQALRKALPNTEIIFEQ